MQIYKTTNLFTGQIYIGKDKYNKPKYYGSGKYLVRALKKHGIENFKKEVIDQCYSFEHMNFMEYFHIQMNPECKVENGGYNISDGGEGNNTKRSDETKKKISLARKGKQILNETKIKMSLAKKGKRSSFKGKKHSKETIQKLIGRKNTEETRQKMSLAQMGHGVSKETRLKMSLSRKGIKRGSYKKHK